jgi:hypothetical protein
LESAPVQSKERLLPSTAVRFRCLRAAAAILFALAPALAQAQIPDLRLPGNLPGQLTEFGVAERDALRQKLGTCGRPAGIIVICGHSNQYRINRNVFEAERDASGPSSEYERYLAAKSRNPTADY